MLEEIHCTSCGKFLDFIENQCIDCDVEHKPIKEDDELHQLKMRKAFLEQKLYEITKFVNLNISMKSDGNFITNTTLSLDQERLGRLFDLLNPDRLEIGN